MPFAIEFDFYYGRAVCRVLYEPSFRSRGKMLGFYAPHSAGLLRKQLIANKKALKIAVRAPRVRGIKKLKWSRVMSRTKVGL